MLAGEAKAMDRALISSVFPLTGNAALTKALAPPVNIAMESVKALEDQTAVSSIFPWKKICMAIGCDYNVAELTYRQCLCSLHNWALVKTFTSLL